MCRCYYNTTSISYQGYYYLFYSSGWYFEAKYHMRVAKAKHPTGPFIKRNYPVLETDWALYGSVRYSRVISRVSQGVIFQFSSWERYWLC